MHHQRFLKFALIFVLAMASLQNSYCQCNDSLKYGTSLPIPLDKTNKNHLPELNQSLQRIKAELPYVKQAFVPFFVESTDSTDWLAILNIFHQHHIQAVVAFYDSTANSGFIPTPVGPNNWNLGKLGNFITCKACITHPAVAFIGLIDEPFEISPLSFTALVT